MSWLYLKMPVQLCVVSRCVLYICKAFSALTESEQWMWAGTRVTPCHSEEKQQGTVKAMTKDFNFSFSARVTVDYKKQCLFVLFQ